MLKADVVVEQMFELNLRHGPYTFAFTHDGRHVLLAGRRGHLALLDRYDGVYCHMMGQFTELRVGVHQNSA